MMEILTEISQRKPQSERDALMARAAIQLKLARIMDEAGKPEHAADYRRLYDKTQELIRGLPK